MVDRCSHIIDSLIEQRHNKGMTQKELANSVGVTNRYISLIERKNLIPSADVMKKISKCLGVSVQTLFFEKLIDMEEGD